MIEVPQAFPNAKPTVWYMGPWTCNLKDWYMDPWTCNLKKWGGGGGSCAACGPTSAKGLKDRAMVMKMLTE